MSSARDNPKRRVIQIQGALQALLEDVVSSTSSIRGGAVHVEAPQVGLSVGVAAGLADPDEGVMMTTAHPVRIASNTKTFVAAAVLRAWEENLLDLDQPVERYLKAEWVEMLKGDGYRPAQMTLRHLLTHTSGLYDHSDSEKYTQAILADPYRHWTPIEQLAGAMEWGKPLAGPGEVYAYCDTGYVLLGEVLQNVTGNSLPAAVRQLIDFSRVPLESTYWELLEPTPAHIPARAHQYLGELDVTHFKPYYDLYGGGGLVSTVEDLAKFYRALFRGGLFAKAGTADHMLETLPGVKPRPGATEDDLPPGAYRMGIVVEKMEGAVLYSHTGFFGTSVSYFPEDDISIAFTLNQREAKGAFAPLLYQVLTEVRTVK